MIGPLADGQKPTTGAAVEEVLAELEPDRTSVVDAVGYLLAQWRSRDD